MGKNQEFRDTTYSGIAGEVFLKNYVNKSPDPLVINVELFDGITFQLNFSTKQKAEDFLDFFKNFLTTVVSFDKDFINLALKINPQTPYVKNFLSAISEFEPSVKDMLPEICNHLKISLPFLEVSLEKLKRLPPDEAIKQALEAQNKREFDLIWQLLTHYTEVSLTKIPVGGGGYLVSDQHLYHIASAVSIENPHYQEAQDKCVEFLAQLEVAKTFTENYTNLQLKFRHALKGSHQELTDHFFHELSGGKLEEEKEKNIKGEADSLIALAARIKKLKEENAKLTTNYSSQAGFFASSVQKVAADSPLYLSTNVDQP